MFRVVTLRVAVRPAGVPAALRVTFPEKPLRLVILITVELAEPG